MKKQGSLILLILTLVFGFFSLGFFVGRNYTHSPVQVSAISAATVPTAAATLPTAAVSATAQTESVPEPTQTEAAPETTQPEPAPVETEPEPLPETTAYSGLIDINTADRQTLMLLPGIGEVLSQRIVDYRTEHGPFASLDELLNVNGIGEKRLEALLPFATVGG